jgi:hypothetical protein
MRRSLALIVLLAAAGAALLWLALHGRPADPGRAAGPAPAALEPPARERSPAELADTAADSAAAGREAAAAAAQPARSDAPPAAGPPQFVVRTVDARGRALPGVSILCAPADGDLPDPERTAPEETARRPWVWRPTEADGRLAVRGLPPGPVRVEASKDGYQVARAGPLDPASLQAGELHLTLLDAEAEGWMEIVVLQPDGRPCANAEVEVSWECDTSSTTEQTSADAAGRLRALVREACPVAVRAIDPEGRFGAAEERGLSRMQREVVLRLSAPFPVRLRVLDAHDRPIASFEAVVTDPIDEDRRLGGAAPAPDDVGTADLGLPHAPCVVLVSSEGYERARLGPFTPPAVPAELVARLQTLPGLRGRVVAAGKPVEGATVGVHAAYDDAECALVDGLPARSERSPRLQRTSAADGSFAFTLRTETRIYVRAEASGFAPAELGPFDYDPRAGLDGLELRLSAGGAIEGVLVPLPGDSAQGRLVAASRGDGRPRVARTDTAGRYRLERLTPGRWLVRVCGYDVDSNASTVSIRGRRSASQGQELPWSVEVAEGATARWDIDLTALPRLEGRIDFGGPRPGTWHATLRREPDDDEQSDAELDAQGRFRLLAQAPGEHALLLWASIPDQAGAPASLSLRAQVRLGNGPTPWAADLRPGRLEISGPRAGSPDVGITFRAASGLEGVLERPSARVLPAAPAGTWTASDGSRELARVELAPGGSAVLQIP